MIRKFVTIEFSVEDNRDEVLRRIAACIDEVLTVSHHISITVGTTKARPSPMPRPEPVDLMPGKAKLLVDAIRRRNGRITSAVFAARIGMTPSSIAKVRKGRNGLSRTMAANILAACETNGLVLLGEERQTLINVRDRGWKKS